LIFHTQITLANIFLINLSDDCEVVGVNNSASHVRRVPITKRGQFLKGVEPLVGGTVSVIRSKLLTFFTYAVLNG
jgi:hypothetical protein